MKLVAVDTETLPFSDKVPIPPLVSVQFYDGTNSSVYIEEQAKANLLRYMHSGFTLVFHNAQYDIQVLEKEFGVSFKKLLEADRIKDVYIISQLQDIAEGIFPKKYGLAALSERHLSRVLPKDEQMNFASVKGQHPSTWRKELYEYAINDAIATFDLYTKLRANTYPPEKEEGVQVRAAYVLGSIESLQTDPLRVNALRQELETHVNASIQELLETDVYEETKKGKLKKNVKNIKARVEKALASPPTTKKGNVKTDEATLRLTDDPVLLKLADMSYDYKLLTTYIPVLEARSKYPIRASYRPLVASNRTSCHNPNDQNLPADDRVRSCYVPRQGHLFVTADYDTIEMRALAQVSLQMFGESDLATAINAGKDLHIMVAAQMMKVSYEEALELYKNKDSTAVRGRKLGKVANFGFFGCLQPKGFVRHAKTFGFDITIEESWEIYNATKLTWRELPRLTLCMKRAVPYGQLGTLRHPLFSFTRGRVTGPEWMSGLFQSAIAYGAKIALWRVKTNIPYDIVAFVHDEVKLQVPEKNALEASEQLNYELVKGMKEIIRDVEVTCSVNITDRWYKEAEPVYNERGELTVWHPT